MGSVGKMTTVWEMEFFEVNVETTRKELKANKTYKEISNLFKTYFPEVRRRFSERNVPVFCGIPREWPVAVLDTGLRAVI